MARNKAVFDADILINLVKTNSFDYLASQFEMIYVADYVWNNEIKNNTDEKRFLQKKLNQGLLVILEYSQMTPNQKNQGFLPKTIRGKNGQALDFAEIMAKCSDKFTKNTQLSALLNLLLEK